MEINLAEAETRSLSERAAAFGFAEASEFATALLKNIAALSDEAVVFAPMSEEQRRLSESILRRGEDDLAAGRVREMRQGLLDLGSERGFELSE
ncbi:hypothetical protein [Botrimarina sp.]|uniref:hypothetical protein n=1 Tax=Botrimarina sp. TaxID=2795802 RepID=UPI0032F042CF